MDVEIEARTRENEWERKEKSNQKSRSSGF